MTTNVDPNSNEDLNNDNPGTDLEQKLADLQAELEAEKSSKNRILEESKKYKEGYQTFKQKQEELDAQKTKIEEEKLIKEGQFSTIIEQREARIKELEDTLDNTVEEVKTRDSAITNFKKASAFERALGGSLKKDAYWNHVDFDKIAINPDNGSIDKASLQTVVSQFTEDYGELVDFGNNPNLPNQTPGGGSGKLTHAQWVKLPLAEKKKRMKDVVD
tara:strand:+ start:13193 stop:13843 length:651 start_codon:yes stop_codon:yes gene_type:complete